MEKVVRKSPRALDNGTMYFNAAAYLQEFQTCDLCGGHRNYRIRDGLHYFICDKCRGADIMSFEVLRNLWYSSQSP